VSGYLNDSRSVNQTSVKRGGNKILVSRSLTIIQGQYKAALVIHASGDHLWENVCVWGNVLSYFFGVKSSGPSRL